jgi:hypothetical protein
MTPCIEIRDYGFVSVSQFPPKSVVVVLDICQEGNRHLIAGYKYLAQAIRNRDAHNYIADQRRKDFPAVEPTFVPASNILVEAMERNHHFGR